MSKIGALVRKDARGIYRDGFLLYMCAYVPLVAIASRLGVPWIPVENLALYLAPWLVTLGGSIAAIIFGFGLIEERERQTLLLLRVLPLSRTAHFGYLDRLEHTLVRSNIRRLCIDQLINQLIMPDLDPFDCFDIEACFSGSIYAGETQQ